MHAYTLPRKDDIGEINAVKFTKNFMYVGVSFLKSEEFNVFIFSLKENVDILKKCVGTLYDESIS